MCISQSILGLFKIKLCGNRTMPGANGDGLVPIHSSAGYADTGSHSNHNDGSAKYVFRAYEQTPTYPFDHLGMLSPLVSAGSLRLAVSKSASCANRPAVDAALPDASIIYDDADGAVTQESSPLNTLVLCGNSLWTGQPPVYGTCLSTAGCCTAFSNGNAGGCACGETLCKQAQFATRSYYTTNDCSGTEYSSSTGPSDFESYDGLGMAGSTTKSIVARSARRGSDGRCELLLKTVCYGHLGNCCENLPWTSSLSSVRVVYRPTGSQLPPSGGGPGIVVTSEGHPNSLCP